MHHLPETENWREIITLTNQKSKVMKFLLQVSKPYASFFSDENLESMRKNATTDNVQGADGHVPHDDETMHYANTGDADQGQADDIDNADGDAEMYDADE